MNENTIRMTESSGPPSREQVEMWLGRKAFKFWMRISGMIDQNYPGVFAPEWLFGGKKHGWSLRYKKSKSFCTLIPEKGRCLLLIVFGADERAKVESIRSELSDKTCQVYDDATTYHDGKWLLLCVDAEKIVADVERLLNVKRRPKNIKTDKVV
ncbi:MAG TPA: DUF3788 domain-containing protein [Candidatus Hydrogenedentes bacterium]|nr:DUF3788 domain-containing protein [Candidatus Hydrogenedentota bacterium]